MQELITPCQASFVAGHQGVDNVAICQELVHTMRHTKARKGVALIKVDLEKSYNRLEWTFIAEMSEDVGMSSKIREASCNSSLKGSDVFFRMGMRRATSSFAGVCITETPSPHIFLYGV